MLFFRRISIFIGVWYSGRYVQRWGRNQFINNKIGGFNMVKDLKYVLGLDLGVASIGWAVMKYNENDEPEKLIDTGVVVFSSLDNDKGKLYNADRLRRIKGHIVSSGLTSKDELYNLYNSKIRMGDVYSLRIAYLNSFEILKQSKKRLFIHGL